MALTKINNQLMDVDAAAIRNTPAGELASTNVQSALNAIVSRVNLVTNNSQGVKTISASAPSGGADGDVWYQI